VGRERLVISHCGSHNKTCIKSGSRTEKGWEALDYTDVFTMVHQISIAISRQLWI